MQCAKGNKNIFIFFAGDLVFFFSSFACEERPAQAMYLNKHDCCVCTPLQGFLLTRGTKLYIRRRLLVFRVMTLKSHLVFLGASTS